MTEFLAMSTHIDTTFASVSPGGSYSNETVTCNLGPLPSGSASNMVITVVPTSSSSLTNTATVSCVTPDPDTANNAATILPAVMDTGSAIVLQDTNQPPAPIRFYRVNCD